jgi:hypothetical protein
MAEVSHFQLAKDKKGVIWDLVLYIPTFVFLILYASKLWVSGNTGFTYVLIFASTIILLMAVNRIFKTRLMILPGSPVALNVSKKAVSLELNNSDSIDLVKDVRFFADFAGKSFGISGLDLSGKTQKFVFHRGQFEEESMFNDAKARLRVFK